MQQREIGQLGTESKSKYLPGTQPTTTLVGNGASMGGSCQFLPNEPAELMGIPQ
jgi:hypothetical protein